MLDFQVIKVLTLRKASCLGPLAAHVTHSETLSGSVKTVPQEKALRRPEERSHATQYPVCNVRGMLNMSSPTPERKGKLKYSKQDLGVTWGPLGGRAFEEEALGPHVALLRDLG